MLRASLPVISGSCGYRRGFPATTADAVPTEPLVVVQLAALTEVGHAAPREVEPAVLPGVALDSVRGEPAVAVRRGIALGALPDVALDSVCEEPAGAVRHGIALGALPGVALDSVRAEPAGAVRDEIGLWALPVAVPAAGGAAARDVARHARLPAVPGVALREVPPGGAQYGELHGAVPTALRRGVVPPSALLGAVRPVPVAASRGVEFLVAALGARSPAAAPVELVRRALASPLATVDQIAVRSETACPSGGLPQPAILKPVVAACDPVRRRRSPWPRPGISAD